MKRFLPLAGGAAFIAFLALIVMLAMKGGIPVLDPSGSIGVAERDLMVHTTLLMLIVAVPVYALAALIAIRYRAQNTKAAYTPDWEHSRMEEFVWWVIPFEIILVLGALTWSATHKLDPQAPLQMEAAPYTVQVVALPWKWLFIYPDANVASVNELNIPAGRDIDFQITADAPMNSFWIPALGGQVYAMPGMATRLHLTATSTGSYQGLSANYSGEGFGKMTFLVHVLPQADFAAWEKKTQEAPSDLSPAAYESLAEPSANDPVRYYGSISFGFGDILHESIGLKPD
jgi:cytochrome o ubiquinol oxidase subunit 2